MDKKEQNNSEKNNEKLQEWAVFNGHNKTFRSKMIMTIYKHDISA